MGGFRAPISVEAFVDDQVKIVPFPRIETKPEVGDHGVDGAVILDEG
jgi:hypothetical protein